MPPVVDVIVPTFVGQNESDAVAQGTREHLQMLVIARRISDQFPKGVVMGQDPVPNMQVRQQRRISLIVSDGVQYVSLPDFRDQSMREVGLVLAHLHLRPGKTKVVDDDAVDAGHVVAQDPLPLDSVREGTPINLTVSSGPPPAVTVPDFVGLQIDDARLVASNGKIRLGQVIWTPFGSDGPPRGVIVRQKPAADKSIDGRGMVSLQVSAGPHQFGYLVREVHAVITVPNDNPSSHLRILAVDAMGSHPVYDAFGAAGQRLDLVTTTVGTAHLETYLNNALVDTTQLGREPASKEEDAAAPGSVTTVLPAMLDAPKKKQKESHR